MQRRKFLQYATASGLGLLGSGYLYKHNANAEQNQTANISGIGVAPDTTRYTPLLVPGDSGPLGMLDMSDERLTLSSRSITMPLMQGKPSPFLTYAAQYSGKDYQNPIIRIKRGDRFKARLQNDLNEPTIIHWHGLHIPSDMDGHPRQTVAPGGHFDYAFNVPNRAAMYWYHTHAHHISGKQAFFGQAGLYIVDDEEETALRNALQLEPGVNELPLLIQDKQFNDAGELIYTVDPMQQWMGQLGDTIMVNLTPRPQLDITNRLYRFRICNGSNSRIYKLAFIQRGKILPYAIIGTDAGLLERPYTAQQQFISPGERLDILFDASQLRVGDEVLLKSLAFDPLLGGGMAGMGDLMGGVSGLGGTNGSRLDLGAEFEIMKLAVTRDGAATPVVLPSKLSTIERIDTSGAVMRNVSLSVRRMLWMINGERFEMDRYPLQSRRNTIELWDIQNNADLSMPHPMHMHGFSFQVINRRNSPDQVRRLAQDTSGRQIADLGWKDTVLLWPGETVRIAIDFTHPHSGDQIFLFHCHNLEHEDQGMMVNHLITSA